MTGNATLPVSNPLRWTAGDRQSTGVGNCIGPLCLAISGELLRFFRPQPYAHTVSLDEGRRTEAKSWLHSTFLGVSAYMEMLGKKKIKKSTFLTK